MKKIYLWIVLMLAVLMIPSTVLAKSNPFHAGENVTIEEDIDSSLFVAGNDVEVKSNVDGICFAAGETVKVSGAQDHLFAAGNRIEVKDVNVKDAFVAGRKLVVTDSSIRNLFIAGENITIDAVITNDVHAAGNTVTIKGTVYGDVYVEAEKVVVDNSANIYGTLNYLESAKLKIAKDASVGEQKVIKEIKEHVAKVSTHSSHVGGLIFAAITMIIIAMVFRALFPGMFTKITEQEKTAVGFIKTIGLGFLLLIIVPVAALVLLLTIVGIPISLILITIYVLLIYLSAIPTAAYVGKWIAKDKIKNDYLLLALSILALYILRMIPYIRGWVTFISLCFGLGSYLLCMVKKTEKKKK